MNTSRACLLALFTCLLVVSAAIVPPPANAQASAGADGNRITLDFENLADLEKVTNQFAANFGVSFGGATVLGQGASLNFLNFPPRSGVNVLYDDPTHKGRITITFDPAVAITVTRVGAYVTGNRNVSMTAYDVQDNVLGSVSTGGANAAPGGVPNKLLEISATQSIKTVIFFNGGERGNTYTVDDFYFETGLACDIDGVPLYKQANASWANDRYGGTTENPWQDYKDHEAVIRDWGCALTSTAMIVSYYGDLQGEATTDPGELNTWLKGHHGYTGGKILWAKVAEFARNVKNIDLYYYGGGGANNGVINAYLCNGAPMVLFTNTSPYPADGHYVVATGVNSTTAWDVNDPGGFDINSLASQPERPYQRYGSQATEPTYLALAIHPPNAPSLLRDGANAAISILITDPAGRTLRYDALSGVYENKILDAQFGVERLGADDGSGRYFETYTFETGAPLAGKYQVQITSHTTGHYELDLLSYDSSDTSSSATTAGFALAGSELVLGIGYSPEPGSELEVTPPDWVDSLGLYLPLVLNVPLVDQLALTSDRDGNNEIYLMNSNGSNTTRLTNNPASDWAPAWSPDGNWIAFTSDRDGDSEIYIMRADGSGLRKLTDNTAYDCCADWSPDGTKIAFNSNLPDGDQDIYVINIDGTGRKNLTNFSADDWSPAWSPNGTEILFDARRDGHADIYVMNADGSNLRRLTTRYSAQRGANWSPDGQRIVYHSNQQLANPDQTGYEHIFTMRRDGTLQTQLTNTLADDTRPDWHYNGQLIVFTSERDGNSEIYVMNQDGTGVRRITNHPATDIGAVWRPRGG